MGRPLSIALLTVSLSLLGPHAFAAEGRTVGHFGVSRVGSAQYTIPIWTPPGIRGLQPRLALTYDSGSSAGILGPGWNLAGLSAISRCNRTYAQDGTPAAITLTLADAFCLDGSRLRLTSSETLSTYGEAGTTYQTEIANFSNVTANGTAGNGPSYFTVQGKNGLTYEYGNTTDSKVLPPGGTTPYSWALDKVTDRAGNYMTYTYSQTSGAYVLASIKYTALSGSTTFVYQVEFGYTTLSEPTVTYYLSGSQIQQTQQLSTISVQLYNTTTDLRVYKLTYTNSTGTVRPRLATIQECGGSTGTDCLAATSVGYQNGTVGVASATTATGSGATNGNVYSVDIDGDGKQDLVFATTNGSGNYVWWVQFATATGYSSPVSTGAVTSGNLAQNGVPSLVIDNFDGKIGNEIIGNDGGTLYIYKWNGTSFTATSLGITVQSGAIYASADVNGDGRPDLVYIVTTAGWVATPISVMLNTTTTGAVSFAAPVTTSWSTLECCETGSTQLIGDNVSRGSTVKKMDFDGDGRSDLILTTEIYRPALGTYTTILYTLLSRGTGPFVVGTASNITSVIPYPVVLPVNWNDDACTDVTFQATVVISECNGSYASVITLGAVPSLALDWDGDGRTDLLANVSGTWQLYRSLGNGVASPVSTGISVGTGSWTVTDKNGDGLDDLVFAESSPSNAIYYGLHNGGTVKPDLATSFTDGYGNTFSPSYTSIAESNYQSTSDAAYPYQDYFGPLYVVYSAKFSDPSDMPSGTYTQSYYYYGAWMNMQGRGFMGFNSYSVVDSRTALFEHPYYQRAFPYTGMMYEDVFSNSSVYPSITEGTPAMETLDSTANNERYFPYFSGVTTNRVEVGGTENGDQVTSTVTSYTFDNYGNATTVATVVTDTDPGSPYLNDTWTSTTVNTITPNTTDWCLSLPTQTTVTKSSTAPGGAAITRTVTYTPDYVNCRQTQRVIAPGTAYQVTEAYGYDTTVGNLLTDTVTGTGMAARVASYTWNSTGQFPATVKNALSQSITLGFDPNTGRKTSQTDPNYTSTNPLTTTWTYDDFARKTSELRPDGTSTTWSYNACATNGCVNTNNQMTVTQTAVNIGGSTQSVQNTYLDTLDRTLVTSKQMISGAYDRNEVQYDNLGRVHQQGAPCTFVSCTNYWTTNTYDVLNRLTESQRPISATNSSPQTTTVAYAGRTTTLTDALNNATTKINLVTGPLARTKDSIGYYVNFTYDAFGSLVSTTDSASPANTLSTATYQYGLSAFVTAFTDMDAGARSYTVDPLGEVTAYSDANSNHFSVTYDALSRPLVRTEPDLTTTWVWGNTASTYNIGKLQSVTSTGSAGSYIEADGYDSKTRLSTRALTLPGDATYTYTQTYNATTGLPSALQYPVSTSSYQLQLNYAYQYGILQSVTDSTSGTVYWLANAANPRGQVTQETLGNGVVTNRSFDAVTGWIGSIQAGVSGGSGLQNNAFAYDYMGDVTQRQDNNQGLTENFYYDADYRLSYSTLGGVNNLTMTYDTTGMGNIASRSDVAGGTAWTYDPVRKHAVTQAGTGGYSFTYDGNGNALTRNGYANTWTSYNYPSGVNAAGESATFQYGPDRQRWQTIYTGSIGTETTYHVGKLLEKVTNSGALNYRHYIYAGNELVAIYSRTSAGSNTVNYVLGDHQSSFTDILTSTGTLDVSESFTPYGNRRSGETWSGAPSTPDETAINTVSRWGYTDQTVLGVSMGLNHMNGRVQDAITGRFLSPDPYIPNPGNTQSYNRYSYANNNPVTVVDPTGFDDCANTGCVKPVDINSIDSLWNMVAGGIMNELSCAGNCDPQNSAPQSSSSSGSSGGTQPGTNASDPNKAAPGPNTGSSDQPAQSQTPQSPPSSDGLQEIVVTAQILPQTGEDGLEEVTVLASAKEPTGEVPPIKFRNAFPNPNEPFPQCDQCGIKSLQGQGKCWQTYGAGTGAGAACVLAWKEWTNQCVPNSC
jgi:RHS repeat-associated protein